MREVDLMAYHPNGNFSLPSSVSYLPNNLSCHANQVVRTLCTPTKRIDGIILMKNHPLLPLQSTVKYNEVNISNYASGESTKVTLNAKTSIFQAALVSLYEETFLIVASSDGTHIYMNDGLEMKFFLPIGVSTSEDANGE